MKNERIIACILVMLFVLVFGFFSVLFITRLNDEKLPANSGGGGGSTTGTYTSVENGSISSVAQPPSPTIVSPPTIEPNRTASEDNIVVMPTQSIQADNSNSTNVIVDHPEYNKYFNSNYSFSCEYPTHFEVYTDHTKTLYTVRSSDGLAKEIISAEPLEGRTIESLYTEYKRQHPGIIDYNSITDEYYAISIKQGDTDYYKKCKIKNGNVYWFEFISPTRYESVYSKYIDRIEGTLTIY